jgi:hypothetical protein
MRAVAGLLGREGEPQEAQIPSQATSAPPQWALARRQAMTLLPRLFEFEPCPAATLLVGRSTAGIAG